jgi:hypothetical protein
MKGLVPTYGVVVGATLGIVGNLGNSGFGNSGTLNLGSSGFGNSGILGSSGFGNSGTLGISS